MFSAKSLPRRTVLRGLGATVALPLLDAMIPALSPRARAAVKPAHRFQAFYVPNGMAMEYWIPKGEGRDFDLSPYFEIVKINSVEAEAFDYTRIQWAPTEVPKLPISVHGNGANGNEHHANGNGNGTGHGIVPTRPSSPRPDAR